MQNLTDITSNPFAKYIYNKPIVDPEANIFTKLITKIKQRRYRKNVILPVYNKLRNKEPSFITLIDFSDFIKIIEKVFFYNNCIEDNKIKLVSDNTYNGSDQVKQMIIANMVDNVIITIKLSREFNGSDDSDNQYNDIINIVVSNKFGKKLKTEFTIVNEHINIDNEDDYNLLFNINRMLMNYMSSMFLEYYDKA